MHARAGLLLQLASTNVLRQEVRVRTCVRCEQPLGGNAWACDACGWTAPVVSGETCLAPDLIGTAAGYEASWFSELAVLEQGNFWFDARNRELTRLARRHLPPTGSYMEIGCGTGYVLSALGKEFPGWSLTATEMHPEGLAFARARVGRNVEFLQMDARSIPFDGDFDVIGAFDVIEHIEEDELVLNQIRKALKPGGYAFVSVPQHMFLWSHYDDLGHHARRYGREEMQAKMRRAGFTIVDSRSFNSLLLPLMTLARLRMRRPGMTTDDVLDELRIGRMTNSALTGVLRLEYLLTQIGVRWPVGGSRIAIGRKAPE